jgi:hypothetical protein
VQLQVVEEAKDAALGLPCLVFSEAEPQSIGKVFLEQLDLET